MYKIYKLITYLYKMTPENFTYWLQGYFEISESKMLSSKQTQVIKDHLALVFTKVTPDRKENNSFEIDAVEELKKSLLLDGGPRDSKAWDLGESPRLCSSVPMDLDLNNKPVCDTAQRFGLGKCNIKSTLYC